MLTDWFIQFSSSVLVWLLDFLPVVNSSSDLGSAFSVLGSSFAVVLYVFPFVIDLLGIIGLCFLVYASYWSFRISTWLASSLPFSPIKQYQD